MLSRKKQQKDLMSVFPVSLFSPAAFSDCPSHGSNVFPFPVTVVVSEDRIDQPVMGREFRGRDGI